MRRAEATWHIGTAPLSGSSAEAQAVPTDTDAMALHRGVLGGAVKSQHGKCLRIFTKR